MKEISPYVKIKFWLWNGGAALLDQGVFSGANFVLSILYSRWVSVEIYGGFSASYSIFLLLSTAQVAFIAEPMSIYGADRYRENLTTYLVFLLRLQLIGSLIVSLLLALVAIFIVDQALSESILAMAISLPFILSYWFLRRAFYIEMRPGKALVSSTIYLGLLVLFVSFTLAFDYINSFTMYFVMALSSLVAGVIAMEQLNIHFVNKQIASDIHSARATLEIWDFGKWVFPAYFASWITYFSYPFIVSVLLDLRSAGALRAMQNLFLPFQQFLAAVTLLLLPWLAKQRLQRGIERLFVATQAVAGLVLMVAMFYCFLVWVFRSELFTFLYANDFYSSFENLTIFPAISVLISSAPLIFGLAFRILDHQIKIFSSKGLSALLTVLLGFPLIAVSGMQGVMLTLVASALFEAILVLLYFHRIKNLLITSYQAKT